MSSDNENVSGSDLLSVSTSTDAARGSYTVTVTNLATAQKLSSNPFTSQSDELGSSYAGDIIVNGKVVTRAFHTNPRKGYICLESEGGVVHFRNIRICELPGSNPPDDVVAQKERGLGAFTKSEVAAFVDRVKHDYGDPDWYTDLKRQERLSPFEETLPNQLSMEMYENFFRQSPLVGFEIPSSDKTSGFRDTLLPSH